MEDTPEKIGKVVRATFKGTGTKKIMLIAHMDTVYQIGMLNKQPFRIEGDKAYGLGIADDKQGIAVIAHTVAMLKAMDFKEYGTLTVLINGDEEISSPGARHLITRLGGEHDVVMSYEGASVKDDKLSLATAGIASVTLNVAGKASHAGSAPELGVNALYELSHQILQMRDLSDPATGLKMNWTISRAGTQPQRDSGHRHRRRRYPRAEGQRLRPHRAAGEGAREEAAGSRSEGRDEVRAPPSAAGGQRRVAWAGAACAADLQGPGQGTRGRRQGGGRWHGRGFRGPEDPRPPWWSASACRVSGRTRPMPNTCWSTRSNPGCTCRPS